MITREEHNTLQQHRLDKSRQRYEHSDPETRERYDATVKLCAGRVLDIGCGQALLGSLLKGVPSSSYIGIDSWELILKEAPPDVRVQVDDAEHLPFGDEEFDTVVMGQVLEHVFNEHAAAGEAVRVLKQGGRLIVNVPRDEPEPRGAHVRVFTLDSLFALFRPHILWYRADVMGRFWFLAGNKI